MRMLVLLPTIRSKRLSLISTKCGHQLLISSRRRYTIRVRAETDQFLLCCVELSTFNKWLEGLFAAIDIALPLEDRDFPRDMSIPRIQRIRWFHGQSPTATAIDLSELGIEAGSEEISAT